MNNVSGVSGSEQSEETVGIHDPSQLMAANLNGIPMGVGPVAVAFATERTVHLSEANAAVAAAIACSPRSHGPGGWRSILMEIC